MPDASSFTWRTKLAATQVNRRSDHVINNSQDTPAPRLFSPQVMSYAGSGFGGRVQDASSYTMSVSHTSINRDVLSRPDGNKFRSPTLASQQCLTFPPASQVVNQSGNYDGNTSGLNMGYTTQYINGVAVANTVGVCTQRFFPQTKSHFVDTIPDLKTRKIGTTKSNGRYGDTQIVQNAITCTTTNTSGATKTQAVDGNGIGLQDQKADVPFSSYSPPPQNYVGSYANAVHGPFVTGIQGPQVGGQNNGGVRADKVGGVTLLVKHNISHRGWGGRTRMPYPWPRVPPTGAPAQLKINEPNHYFVK